MIAVFEYTPRVAPKFCRVTFPSTSKSWIPGVTALILFFSSEEKHLARLIADANPQDATKQSTLLAELNKHSPESVIKRFEERDRAVDSRGVVEYLRALVATNVIA
ncbi:hypothetical protein K1719_019450 [Acacia pycnantha]|nr:hypothetical protein K1719_019450 [Acacia pycnantha]